MAAPPRPLSKGSEAERVLERMRADKSFEALEREALQRLKDDVRRRHRQQASPPFLSLFPPSHPLRSPS